MVFPINGARFIRYSHGKEKKLTLRRHTKKKISSRWIEDLNVKGKIVKPVKDYMEYLHNFAIVKAFLNETKTATSINKKLDKLNVIKM